MTEEAEAAAPAARVDVKEHSCGEEDGHTTYPAALATQEAVCEDGELFTRLLQDLNAKLQTAQPKKYRPSKYRVPIGKRAQATAGMARGRWAGRQLRPGC
jgi:hypothetical protein